MLRPKVDRIDAFMGLGTADTAATTDTSACEHKFQFSSDEVNYISDIPPGRDSGGSQ